MIEDDRNLIILLLFLCFQGRGERTEYLWTGKPG